MGAVWLRARAELRNRWRSWAALALLLGIVGGVALAAAAGARRTSTSFQRLLVQSKAHDVEVQVQEDAPETILDEVAALPQVTASGRVALFPADDQAAGGEPEPFKWEVSAAAVVGDGLTRDLEVPRVVQGRRMRFDDPHEAMASESFVRQRRVGVGDEFTIQTASWPEIGELFGGRYPIPSGPEVTVRITGVWKLPHDVSIGGEEQGILYLSPAFFRTYRERAASFESLMLRLRNGSADVPAFTAAARRLAPNPEALGINTRAHLVADVERSLDVMTIGLWIFAGVVGGVALLIIGQSASRAMAAGADDLATLRALSFDTAQRAAIALIPVAAMTAAGTVIAVCVAVVATPATPLGFVREIEPSPGFSLDAAVLALGALALGLAMTARALVPAVRLARRAARAEDGSPASRPSAIAGGVARAGMSPAAVTGVRFALDPGRGPSGVPVRTVLGGVIMAMLVVAAVSSFGPNIDRLVHRPASYGWTWDVLVFGGEDEQVAAEQLDRLASHPLVGELAAVSARITTFRDEELELLGFRQVLGAIEPAVLDGRGPAAPGEIAFGSDPMRRYGLAIGDTVALPSSECATPGGCPVSFTVVGRVVPNLEEADLGEGAVVTRDGMERVRTTTGFSDYVVGLKPGVSPDEARDRFERDFGDAAVARLPVELRNLDRVRALPDVLALVLVAVALAVVAHALVIAVRGRRRDLAILKTVGFARREVRTAVAWQATTMIVLSLLVGIPGGLVAGRWAWRLTADRIGVASDPATPLATVGVGALALVVVANLVAAWPARRAARTEPAVILRTE